MIRRLYILCALLAAAGAAVSAEAATAAGAAGAAGAAVPLRGISPELARLAASALPDDTLLVWIRFTDRGAPWSREAELSRPPRTASPRAAARRERRGAAPFGAGDLPVASEYIDLVRPLCLRIRHASRYFNAVSAAVTARSLEGISALPFVRSLDRVGVSRMPLESFAVGRETDGASRASGNAAAPGAAKPGARAPRADIYGESYRQLALLNAIGLIDSGYNGSGVRGGTDSIMICLLDSGFRLRHEAFLRLNIRAEWDFIQGDSITENQDGDSPTQDQHGTKVLGVIGGYSEGFLVGPAWGAIYLLAKTEKVDEEIILEEDNWVAGIEWADSAGADVVSSSVGYRDWYSPADFDGNTALCTIAADIAASHGIVVVNSAGNQGTAGLVAPADGDSVIAVGAVDPNGYVTSFSSRGPTADGRIKPDFVAMGYYVRSVSGVDSTEYSDNSGTSFAAPLVAGISALALEIHPDWTPMELLEALRVTATLSQYPDNNHGWGLPDAGRAVLYPEILYYSIAFPNPFNDETHFQFYFPQPERVTVRVFDVSGALVRTLEDASIVRGSWTFSWDGRNGNGRKVTGGLYFISIQSRSVRGTVKVVYIP